MHGRGVDWQEHFDILSNERPKLNAAFNFLFVSLGSGAPVSRAWPSGVVDVDEAWELHFSVEFIVGG